MTGTPEPAAAPELGMTLTEAQAEALARRVVANHLGEVDWLEWGDVPNLSEQSLNLLIDTIKGIAAAADTAAIEMDGEEGIDAVDLWSEAVR